MINSFVSFKKGSEVRTRSWGLLQDTNAIKFIVSTVRYTGHVAGQSGLTSNFLTENLFRIDKF